MTESKMKGYQNWGGVDGCWGGRRRGWALEAGG